jgi:hypothetical protein
MTVAKLVERGTKLVRAFSHIFPVVTLGLALAEFLVALASPQTNLKKKQVTLTGTVTESMCGAKHMRSGDDAKCVRTCVKNGSHYALVVNQKVYPLNGRSEELDGQVGQSCGNEVAILTSCWEPNPDEWCPLLCFRMSQP